MLFDARPQAAVIFKEKLLWLLTIGLFFFLSYGTSNQISASYDSVGNIAFAWERSIPFIAEMIVPYMSLDLLFIISFFLAKSRVELQRHALRLGSLIAFSIMLFLLIPLKFGFERPMIEGWTSPIFQGLAADLPYNQMPALHVSISLVLAQFYRLHFSGLIRWLILAWFIAIILSILVVYQHHFIDLPTGIIAGLLAFYFVPLSGKGPVPLNFVSPKHLYMAFSYLLITTLFTVFAFILHSWICAWIAVSMLIIASLYLLGINPRLGKKQGRLGWLSWLLFWPYLLTNHLSLLLWQHKLPAMVPVIKGLWLGRSLKSSEQTLLQHHQINAIIDLTPEVTSHTAEHIDYFYQPLLDLVIPDPVILSDICDTINLAKQQGNVFIHCKFGLSRSVIVSCAWLMQSQSYSKQAAWKTVSKAQKMRVDRPYVHIALALFEQHLAQPQQIETEN